MSAGSSDRSSMRAAGGGDCGGVMGGDSSFTGGVLRLLMKACGTSRSREEDMREEEGEMREWIHARFLIRDPAPTRRNPNIIIFPLSGFRFHPSH